MLEETGYVTVRKEFQQRKPVSWYSLTPEGKVSLRKHLVALETLINAAGTGTGA